MLARLKLAAPAAWCLTTRHFASCSIATGSPTNASSPSISPDLSVLVSSHHEGTVQHICINRPRNRNALDHEAALRLATAVEAFEADSIARVAVLSGSAGTFCAGYDLKAFAAAAKMPETVPVGQGSGPMGPSRLIPKKPLIAAIGGHAVAGGLELALLCDLRVVEEDATMGVFCRRWGVPLIDGGTVRLQAIVGLGTALDLILTGRPVDASEALSMGLASRVVPKGQSVVTAIALARDIGRFPQACMLKDRESTYNAAYNAASFDAALSFEFENGQETLREAALGAKRFAEGAGRGGSFTDV